MNRRGLFGFFAGAPLGIVAQVEAKPVENPIQMMTKCECGCPAFGHPIINKRSMIDTPYPGVATIISTPMATDPTRWVCMWCGKERK